MTGDLATGSSASGGAGHGHRRRTSHVRGGGGKPWTTSDTLGDMPVRATKRGVERTPLDGSHDVLICGASFAGLAVARELAGSGADVLIIDRYEIGERQTSACGIPTSGWKRWA